MQLDRDTVLQRAENTAYELVADDETPPEAILIHLDTGTYFSLNRVGTEFWVMLDGQRSIADHAQTIAEQYGVEPNVVEADLLELASDMAQDELVTAS